jgi:hypothetical protein
MAARAWLPLLVALLLAGHAQAQEEGWSTSTSGGFALDIPAFFTDGRVEPLIEDGVETGTAYTSEERDAVLSHFSPQDQVRPFTFLRALYSTPDADVTYRLNRADLGALSGYVGGSRAEIFYGICHSQPLRCVTIEYPASEKNRFDPIITRIARSLRARKAAPEVSDARPEQSWVILASVRQTAADEASLDAVEKIAEACGLEFFQENSSRFNGLEPGSKVFVIGPVVDQRSAELLADRARSCFPEARATQARYDRP